ncbi:TaqI-like C-terminal specificity domain-containing protein [Elizabethkingia occulta]|uniref:TaqI-like C-terminal specificity domain-containing protein n=1 Tax=Elizabethkingia occulta TaxID=1867263 RepID=UPI00398C51C5
MPLKDWDINIYRGILTGYNEAFIIDGKKKDELIAEDPKSAEIIRPILRGRDIKRYGYDFADLWLINSHNGIKEKDVKRIEINDYPSIKKHLDQYYPQLERRADKGDTLYNLRNCAYMEDFSKQKIVWKRVGSILRFSYDDTGIMALDSTCFATGKYIKYLVAVLNSKMGKYLMKDSPQTGTGDLLISVQAIEPLKIPIPTSNTEKLIDEIIDTILDNGNDVSYNLVSEIDRKVYNLYNLNDEECSFIESQQTQ